MAPLLSFRPVEGPKTAFRCSSWAPGNPLSRTDVGSRARRCPGQAFGCGAPVLRGAPPLCARHGGRTSPLAKGEGCCREAGSESAEGSVVKNVPRGPASFQGRCSTRASLLVGRGPCGTTAIRRQRSPGGRGEVGLGVMVVAAAQGWCTGGAGAAALILRKTPCGTRSPRGFELLAVNQDADLAFLAIKLDPAHAAIPAPKRAPAPRCRAGSGRPRRSSCPNPGAHATMAPGTAAPTPGCRGMPA